MGEPRDDFLTFALSVHEADGVPAAAILLQDQCAADVDVLLLAAFVGAVHGRAFGSRDLEAALARVGPWQHDVVGPLRVIRRRLKEGPPPAPDPATNALREGIKQIELDAEMIELAQLGELAAAFDGPSAQGTPAERAAAALTVVVRAGSGRAPTAAENAAISVIAAAAAGKAERS
jgi:uncharacterized protein (TIGR02444 family)